MGREKLSYISREKSPLQWKEARSDNNQKLDNISSLPPCLRDPT
jgi:hypothetical protein